MGFFETKNKVFFILATLYSLSCFATSDSESVVLGTKIYFYLENEQVDKAKALISELPPSFDKSYYNGIILMKEKKYLDAKVSLLDAHKKSKNENDSLQALEYLCKNSLFLEDPIEAIYFGTKGGVKSCLAIAYSQVQSCPNAIPLLRNTNEKNSTCVSTYHTWKFTPSFDATFDSNAIQKSPADTSPSDKDSFIFTPKISAQAKSDSLNVRTSANYSYYQQRDIRTYDTTTFTPGLTLKVFSPYTLSYDYVYIRGLNAVNKMHNYLGMHLVTNSFDFESFNGKANLKFNYTYERYRPKPTTKTSIDNGPSYLFFFKHPFVSNFFKSNLTLSYGIHNKIGDLKRKRSLKVLFSLNLRDDLDLEITPYQWQSFPKYARGNGGGFNREEVLSSTSFTLSKNLSDILVSINGGVEFKESNVDTYDYSRFTLGATFSKPF